MDPLHRLNLPRDTSCLLISEALKLNYSVHVFSGDDLQLKNRQISVTSAHTAHHIDDKLTLQGCGEVNLDYLDLVLMREDLQSNMNYITHTHMLDFCRCPVLNTPSAIRNCPEKIWHMKNFPSLPTLITQNLAQAEGFLKEHRRVVLKPLYMKAGTLVKILDSSNAEDLKQLRQLYRGKFILQKHVEGRCSRATIMGGEIVSYLEVPKMPGGFKHNMWHDPLKLKRLDHKECTDIQPLIHELKRRGVFFAGVDMMDQYPVDVNITSPGGLLEIGRAEKKSLARTFWEKLDLSTFVTA